MDHTPTPKGKKISVRRISLTKWDADNNFTLEVKVNPAPKLTQSGKAYILSAKQGESEIVVNVDGVDRKVRVFFLLYCKVPASERRATLAQQALDAELRGEPQLY